MKLAIIADDLTGANDSGVQLARHGLKTSVLLIWMKALLHVTMPSSLIQIVVPYPRRKRMTVYIGLLNC